MLLGRSDLVQDAGDEDDQRAEGKKHAKPFGPVGADFRETRASTHQGFGDEKHCERPEEFDAENRMVGDGRDLGRDGEDREVDRAGDEQ